MTKAFLSTLAFLLTSCATRAAVCQDDPSVQVAAAALAHLEEQAPILLVRDLQTGCHLLEVRGQARSLSTEKLDKLSAALRSSPPSTVVWESLCKPGGCEMITRAELEALTTGDGNDDPMDDWVPLRREFGPRTVVAFGPVAVVDEYAATCWSQSRGFLTMRVLLTLFRCTDAGWTVLEQVELAQS